MNPSLQRRLTLRLALVLAGAFALTAIVLLAPTQVWFDQLEDASLQVQAEQVRRSLRPGPDGPVVTLPAAVEAVYADHPKGYIYAILDADGRLLRASSGHAARILAAAPALAPGQDEAAYRVSDPDGSSRTFYALARRLPDHGGALLLVGQGDVHLDVYADTLFEEFSERLLWLFAAIFAITLATCLWTVRDGFAPVRVLAARAAAIAPRRTDVRLPLEGVPGELRPIVQAFNAALDRLDEGFRAQRRFTADAAHQLRTPLAVITARLDELGRDGQALEALRRDVARMNRLVGQLLQVARLEARAVDPAERFDLCALAEEVVSDMAPLAVRAGRQVALGVSGDPVEVAGDRHAVGEALRNLVENALEHTPPGTEVTVAVGPDGAVTVADAGPGVPEAEREQVFLPFWRQNRGDATGSGLGLAIVHETARTHGGSVEIAVAPNGGAAFTLRLRPAA